LPGDLNGLTLAVTQKTRVACAFARFGAIKNVGMFDRLSIYQVSLGIY
jgi:hypothetical protein